MKKLEYNNLEQQIIIQLLIEDLRNNIDYLVSEVETIPSRKKFQTWFLTPALDVMYKLQKGGSISLKSKEQAAILRSIKIIENENITVEYFNLLSTILAKTETK